MIDPLADTLQLTLGETFRVDRELGGGGMSRVFVAHDLSLDRDVVIKVLSDEQSAGVSAERFRREIQLIARLQHPHVVPILSAGTAGGSLYYVMPFVTGETLRARLAREGSLPIDDVVRLLREVLDALAFAHDHGVVHRDIKPENVLIGAGHAVVADFGIARALREAGNLTSAGFAIGTPTYMAPEQATADPATDHRADLYAVGVLGYELLTGAPPFVGSTQQVIAAHLTTPPAPVRSHRADLPDALADTIMRSLSKNPADRPQSARETIAALGSAAPTSAPRSGTPRSRRRWAVLVAGLFVIVAGVHAARSRTDASPASSVAAGADLIAVMPLSAVSDTSLVRLGQDLVVTLSTNLDGVGSLHTVDAVTLLMRARGAASPLALADARALARELGARSVLTGTLINDGDQVRATVTLHALESDSAIAKATALGAARDIAVLTDSLTWGILRQVWQRGTPPSPVLAGLTTRSVDALRAFLDGERFFQRLEVERALAQYRRAFELDSSFAQAFLRYDYVNGWQMNPPDTVVYRRLQALKDRLPERERLWVELSDSPLPVPVMVSRWRALAARYPEHPPILMSAADLIIHQGPAYGIPIAEARPYLTRLEQLVPDHADTQFHLYVVNATVGSRDATAASAARASMLMGPEFRPVLAWRAQVLGAQARGTQAPPLDSALAVGRAVAAFAGRNTGMRWMTGLLDVNIDDAPYRLAALDRIRTAGIYSHDMELTSAFGEGAIRTSRGDWAGGLRAFRRAEGANLTFAARMSSARLGVIGAWMGAVDAATADSAVRRARALSRDGFVHQDGVELAWLDGLLGVVLGDEPRMQRARRELLADTAAVARSSARSLAGLWLSRASSDAGADTLKAVSDLAMRDGDFLLSVEAVDRLVVACALRRRGTPAEAERYLMWNDAATNIDRSMSVKFSLSPLIDLERGLALEEAGEPAVAAFRLRRAVEGYDQPPSTHRELVADARKRLARLEKTDAASPRTVTP